MSAVVPCRNEAESIAALIAELWSIGVDQVVVSMDPACTDTTEAVARASGATVVRAPSSGYDGPVLAGVAAASSTATHILFLDAGGKYVMDSIATMLEKAPPDAPIVYGVRNAQQFWHQRLGNLMFALVLQARFRGPWVADVSSVRLIRSDTLSRLRLEDRQFSLPFQTTVHALKQGIPIVFIPIRCTATRIGVSKVSGSHRNSARAALQMALSIVKAPRF